MKREDLIRFARDAGGAWRMIQEAMKIGEKIVTEAEPFDPEEEEDGDGRRKKKQKMAAGQELVEELLGGLEQATGLVQVIEDIGQAVADAAENEEDIVEAGIGALQPRGDEDDFIRIGVGWLVEVLTGGAKAKPKRGKKGRAADDEDDGPKRPRWNRRGT